MTLQDGAAARRVVIDVSTLLAAIIVLLVVIADWPTIWDHVAAWQFQLTKETETFDATHHHGPEPLLREGYYGLEGEQALPIDERKPFYETPTPWLYRLAEHSGVPVIFTRVDASTRKYYLVVPPTDEDTRHSSDILRILRANGWRIVEQRFPCRAYIVIRA